MNKKNVLTLILLTGALALGACSSPTRVSSSYWRYTDDDISYEILFRSDGHLYSYHPNDATPEDDYWKQRGRRVIFSMNDGYAHYKGKLINDSTIVGKASSKGFRWQWNAKFLSSH